MNLTDRMQQVLEGIAAGKTNQQIAASLKISAKTVEKHRKKLYDAFGVDNAVTLVVNALKQRVIVL